MAERRRRVNYYVGPKETITREDLDRLEATGEWIFEEKKDGFWCLAVVRDDVIVEMSSRVGLAFEGVETSGLIGKKVGPGSGRLVGELTADVVDGERAGVRRLHLFDVLDWNGLDLRDLSQVERREALELIVVRSDTVVLVDQRTTGAVDFFDEVLARGGEGIVAKRRDAKCRAVNADGKIEAWVRAKKKRTVDYVVLGHGSGAKGTPNVSLGLYVSGRLKKVIDATLPPEWRRLGDLTGSVVEAAGWEVFPSGALRSAQLGHRPGPRTDKLPESCTIEAALEA